MQLYALEGQNYYNAVDVTQTGEINVVKKITTFFGKKKDKLIFFDAGAHAGQYTDMLLSQAGDMQIEAHLFEPQSEKIASLHIKFASFKNFFINHNAVGGNSLADKTLFICSKQNLIATTLEFPLQDFIPNAVFDKTEKVEMITLSEYCSHNNISRIDFLKLDVEGEEYACLEDLDDMIRERRIRCIQFEYGFINMAGKHYFYDFWKLLKDEYEIYSVMIDGLAKIEGYQISLEQMAPMNYFAILK